MDGPVFQDEALDEHHDPESVEGDSGRHRAISKTFVYPFENRQRYAVDQPEREDASDRLG